MISGALHRARSRARFRVISKRWGISGIRTNIDVFLQNGGYQALEKALKQMTPESIIDEMKKSNLRGRGGAGFPTGMKWSFVPKDSPKAEIRHLQRGRIRTRHLQRPPADGDGSAPADRRHGDRRPSHRVASGIYLYSRRISLCAGHCAGSDYAKRTTRGYLGKNILGSGYDFDLLIHTGAGAYECGEESALMESLEGKRGYPRIKPPFPAVVGLYGCPTIINNVETLSAVPAIILGGGEAYANLGTPKNGGTRLLCVAGHVNKPGIYEIPLGMNMKEFIYGMAGGIPGGKKLKAVIPGGSSCPLLTADEIDIPMDYDSVAKAGSMLGSGGMVVMDEDTCMVDMARRIMHFYAHESCGWCIPCREGTTWLRKMLERLHAGYGRAQDIDMISELSKNILGRSFCPLGDAAAMPTISIVQKWRNEFEDHLHGRCAYKSAEACSLVQSIRRMILLNG